MWVYISVSGFLVRHVFAYGMGNLVSFGYHIPRYRYAVDDIRQNFLIS